MRVLIPRQALGQRARLAWLLSQPLHVPLADKVQNAYTAWMARTRSSNSSLGNRDFFLVRAL